ncbi:hypothetical protein bas03_0009 [Escherichia phage JulesPiccard]|uniref:Uncharacterized protein n=1 Tax=Escherichia phage JulesPiccard TaxID=2851956 RepID=A0AAE8B774_9CAUD|nr:hypothetical protein bas03_0009 [Escherichia phage JulesPiccard]
MDNWLMNFLFLSQRSMRSILMRLMVYGLTISTMTS